MNKEKRILIFELNWMGDILFSFPFIRAIRGAFPKSYISCIVVPRYVDLLAHNPWINYVHALSDNNKISSIKEKMAFIRMIRKEDYDTCFLLKPSSSRAVMAVLAGIPERIGFAGKKAPLTVEVDKPSGNLHRTDQLLSLAGAVGVTQADGTYEYFFGEENGEKANALLHEVGGGVHRIIAVNPGGNWEPKRWPTKNFIELVKKILTDLNDIEVMVTGAKKDIELGESIVRAADDKRCYSVAGKTRLNELAALFKKCSLVVSSDSGPLHLASALRTTTIGLFGPTSHKITGPRGRGKNIVIAKEVDCEIPCYVEECDREYACIKAISVDEVFKAAEKALTENESG
jgi:lipopolysaccharide heptosyltransferase II